MEKIKVMCWIDTEAAVAAGRLESGQAEVDVDAAALAEMTESDRMLLARYAALRPEQQNAGRYPGEGEEKDGPALPSPSLVGLLVVLRRREHHRLKQMALSTAENEKKRLETLEKAELAIQDQLAKGPEAYLQRSPTHTIDPWYFELPSQLSYAVLDVIRKDPRVQPLIEAARTEANRRNARDRAERRQKEEEKLAEQKRKQAETEAKTAQFRTAAAAFAARHPELADRAAEGFLSDEELLAAIRDEVFAPLAELERYERLDKDSVTNCACRQGEYTGFMADEEDGSHGKVVFYMADETSTPPPSLNQEEYTTLCRIRRLAPQGATVEMRDHRAYCTTCLLAEKDDGEVSRHSALVSVEWHGRMLSREFSL